MKILSLLLVFTILCSCSSLVRNILVGKPHLEKDLKILKNKKSGQTIVFMPMHHVAKPDYFEKCKLLIDSLRKEKFQFYFETVAFTEDIDSAEKDLYDRKIRSILGHNAIRNSDNQHFYESGGKRKFITQDYNYLGITGKDHHLDLSKKAIIDSIENKYGEIELTECDFKTPLLSKYQCESKNEVLKFAVTNEFRDPYIATKIVEQDEERMVLIYGKQHWYFIFPTLERAGYELIRGKI